MSQIEKLFISSALEAAKQYQLDDRDCPTKIDQNEFPHDWPSELKNKVLANVKNSTWNRYPKPFTRNVDEWLSKKYEMPADRFITGPGSDYLITLVYQALLPKDSTSNVHVLMPSFPVYTLYLAATGRPFTPWSLNASDFSFDTSSQITSQWKPGDMVCFASPNNPTGTLLKKETLQTLLTNHPETLFIADEAYAEFSDYSCIDLINDFDNIIVLRTLSKAGAAAGVRVGYLASQPKWTQHLRKLRLPFMLNHLAVAVADVVLNDTDYKKWSMAQVEGMKLETTRIQELYSNHSKECGQYELISSCANFFLLKFKNDDVKNIVYSALVERGIQTRDVSLGPLLEKCIRVSIGTREENDECFRTISQIK